MIPVWWVISVCHTALPLHTIQWRKGFVFSFTTELIFININTILKSRYMHTVSILFSISEGTFMLEMFLKTLSCWLKHIYSSWEMLMLNLTTSRKFHDRKIKYQRKYLTRGKPLRVNALLLDLASTGLWLPWLCRASQTLCHNGTPVSGNLIYCVDNW